MKNKLNRNAKDKVFKSLLQNRENLARFYFDLTGRRIDPSEIVYDTIATSLVTGREEDVAFEIGLRYIILFEAQSTWRLTDILRFATYMFLLFINFVEEHEGELFESRGGAEAPAVEAYVIYTGDDDLPGAVSLRDSFPSQQSSMINAEMKIATLKNAVGMVREYIEFSKLETEYYASDRRAKSDVVELIDFCIENNILKNYMQEHKREVTNLIENFFTEEKRIQWLINEAVDEAVKEAVDEAVDKAVSEKQQELERIHAENEIAHLSELDIPREKIVEVTGYPPELVEQVLNNS